SLAVSNASLKTVDVSPIFPCPIFREFADVEVCRYRDLRRHRVPVLRDEGRTALDEKKPLIGTGGAGALAESTVVGCNPQLLGQEADHVARIQDQMTGALMQLRPVSGV